jgi:transposase-like protein
MARPHGYNKEVADRIVEAVRNGCNREDSARVAGINKSTLYRWMAEIEEFRDRIHDADSKAVLDWEQCVNKAALTDWKAAVRMLESKRQKEWGRNSRVAVANADNKPFQTVDLSKLTPEEIQALAAIELTDDAEA